MAEWRETPQHRGVQSEDRISRLFVAQADKRKAVLLGENVLHDIDHGPGVGRLPGQRVPHSEVTKSYAFDGFDTVSRSSWTWGESVSVLFQPSAP